MRVEQHRLAAPAQLLEQRAHRPAADGVERGGGLVEQQHVRPPDHRLGDPQPLLHALRHRLDVALARVGEADELEQLVALGLAAARARELLVQDEHLVGRRPAGEAEQLGQVAEGALDPRDALGGVHEPAAALHERRLAGAVGPEQADELALAHLEIDAAESDRRPVPLDQPAGLEHRHRR
jgi:hypothetical protein